MEVSEMLNGSWVQVYSNEDGIDNPEEEKGLGSITTFRDGEFIVYSTAREIVLKGEYRVRSDAIPPEIDWIDSIGVDVGKMFQSIYELTNDSFVFCAADEGMARPRALTPQKGHTIRKFSRLIKHA